jgi:CrcB protein
VKQRSTSTLERGWEDQAAMSASVPRVAPEEMTAPYRLAGSIRGIWTERLRRLAAVGAGGFLGANARYQLGVWAAAQWGAAFPWGTLLINLVGSFILGFYLTLVTERFTGRPTTRLFLATGFLGAFTTFSTFSLEIVRLLAGGAPLPALAYLVGSLVLGLGCGVAGILAAHAL